MNECIGTWEGSMEILIKVVLPLGLAFIMFSLGLGLTMDDFKRVVKRPTAFLIGAFNQIILLPIIAFLVILAFGIKGELAIGIMILASCPGGVTSNIIARFAKADVALSVSLTAIISLTTMITVPLILAFSFGYFLEGQASPVNITKTAVTMFALTVLPIALALLAQRKFPDKMRAIGPLCARIATALFAIIVLAALASNWSLFVENVLILGPALVTLILILMAMGFFIPRIFGRNVNEAKTISIETGIQNGTLGIAIAALLISGETGFTAFSLPSAAYGIFMYMVALPIALGLRQLKAHNTP